MLLGEPSPALSQINAMNTAQLEAKIRSLIEARTPLEKSSSSSRPATSPRPSASKNQKLILRLMTLEKIARERLQGKLERKAQWEQSRR